MGYHHLALAARDMAAIHHFYEEVMGFELVKVEVATVPDGGWAKHFFYRMDGDDSRFIAFWELHDVPGTDRLETNLSRAAGVPDFINHIAFAVPTADELARRKQRWLAADRDVLEIDHGWCHSIYTKDPNGNLVEFCLTTGTFTAADRAAAIAALTASVPAFSKPPPRIEMHRASANTRPV
jgi:catechol 2,3-dioxygenase-like lactoylglutathione lyase family enzyme